MIDFVTIFIVYSICLILYIKIQIMFISFHYRVDSYFHCSRSMKYKMEDSSFEEDTTRTRRRPPRSKNKKHTSMRGNPEGASLYQKQPTKIVAPPNTDNEDSFEVHSPRKRAKKVERDAELVDKRQMVKKKKSMYSDTDLSSLDVTDTPDTLSQSSAIAPVSDVSMMTTFRNPRGRHDMGEGSTESQGAARWC